MIYSLLTSILNTLLNFLATFNSRMNSLEMQLSSIEGTLKEIRVEQIRQGAEQNIILNEILQQLQPPPAVGLSVTFVSDSINNSINNNKEGNNMNTNSKAALDFQLLDDGTATATVSFLDSKANPTAAPIGAAPAVFTSSDPAISVTPTGPLTASLTPNALATGVIITATVSVTDPAGIAPPSTLTGQGNPIDVVAGSATSLAIAEQ